MCDTIVIREKGRTYFAKNSDRDPNEAQVLEWHPAQSHPAGTRLRCTWIEIPQVPRTYATLLSRPFWMWGAEIGANEQGVVIGNEAVFTKEPYAATGLTGMDLLRLALERGDSAWKAVDIIRSLLAEHGQGGGCGYENRRFTYHNSYLIADPNAAFVLETAGKESAVEEVQGVRTISNGLTIDGFAARYSDRIKTSVSACRTRQRRSSELAQEISGVSGLFGLLRDHAGSAYPRNALLNGGMRAVCMHAGGVVASAQTTASWVTEITENRVQHWVTGTAAPCMSLFKPVAIAEPLHLGAPTGVADEQSLWWRGERLHRRVLRNPQALLPLYVRDRDNCEARWRASWPSSEEAFATGDRLLEEWTARVAEAHVDDMRPLWLRQYWAKRNRQAGLAARALQPLP